MGAEYDATMLDLAHVTAKIYSGCTKVRVGAVICDVNGGIISVGANETIPKDVCKCKGCLRIERYGNNDKTHRAPADCRAIHAEISAIAECAAYGKPVEGGTLYVTRYPCENCARAIVAAGIDRVVYGRAQEISEDTKEIFKSGDVTVVWLKNWTAPDATN